MSDIRLSICIPTYNFGRYIGETLESITAQARDRDDIEIVIVDGGSTDNTADVVLRFQRLFSRLHYYRLEKKGGIDQDLAKTVEWATGEYCWLLSSDDVPTPGAIGKILQEIESKSSIYLFNRIDCDSRLNPLRTRHWLKKKINDRIFTFTGPVDFIDYFHHSRSLGALFSYVSSIIVRRTKWNGIQNRADLMGTNYAHVGRLFCILQRGGWLKYIKEPLVYCRGYNDSFLREGLARRLMIDIDGYLLLASALFPDDEMRNAFLAVMHREHKWYVHVELRSLIPAIEDWYTIERKLSRFGYSGFELFFIRTFGSLKMLIKLARLLILFYRRIQFLMARVMRPFRQGHAASSGLSVNTFV